MKNKPPHSKSLIHKIAGLSVGTIFARVLSTVGQLLLAFWISPEEFGYWAAATSAISLVGGLTNFGQVNAYLSGGSASHRIVKKTTLRYNLTLTLLGGGIVALYLFHDKPYIALLAFIAAITIPFTGLAELSYAVAVKHHAYRKVVLVQVFAAAGKMVVGISIAVFFQSAMALAISILFFSVAMHYGLRRIVRVSEGGNDKVGIRPSGRTQFMWAVNSLAMTLPLQIGFLIVQFLAAKELLGLFYMAFQVTVGISGLVAGPLAKVSLATLGSLEGRLRLMTAMSLSGYFAHGMLFCSAIVSFALPLIGNYVPGEWRAAVPAVGVLMASMPVRIMGPVVDSFQQASNRWWQSTSFNIVDAIGTAVAAVFALTGDLMIVVTALALWKISLATFRAWFVYRKAGLWINFKLSFPILLGSLLLCWVPFIEFSSSIISASVALMAILFIVFGKRIFRVGSGHSGDLEN